MEEIYDQFPINLLETNGEISREPFSFMVNTIIIWENGHCIIKQRINGAIKGTISNERLHVELRNIDFGRYVSNELIFSEISLNKDRILWSNDLFNGGYSPATNIPAFLSLFYKNGNLSKLQFSNQNYLIEFYGSPKGKSIFSNLSNLFR